MRCVRVVCAGLVTAIAVALAVSGAQAQSATNEPIGQPLALLAGLRPPHEAKHKNIKHPVHAKAERSTIKTSAAKTRRSRIAAEHARHLQKITRKEHEHRERPIAASAFAEEPPAQTAPNPAPAVNWPAESASAPTLATTPSSADTTQNATAVDGQTARMETLDQVNAPGLAAQHDAAPVAPATPSNDRAAAAPAPNTQTVFAAPAHRQADPVGSASWIAQVLAALGGAVTAGAVAWFLIGGGPVRTYG